MTEPNETRCTITGLVGVYNADGTIRGELAYWVGKRLGRAHCALCDITHGSVKERPEWKRCRDGLPVPFDTYHRDDQPESTRELTAANLPAVIAVTDDGPVLLLGPAELESIGASPERLVDAIECAAEHQDLDWR